jgi:plastocyanin domain-containing protein
MSVDRIVVTLIGLGAIAFVVWFFWLVKRKGARAGLTPSGIQEAMVVVRGGYTPDMIVVEHGKLVRLKFRREESASCSEMVLLPDFNKSASLPQGEVVPIEFLPQKPGEYEFRCQMGMFRGKLIAE